MQHDFVTYTVASLARDVFGPDVNGWRDDIDDDPKHALSKNWPEEWGTQNLEPADALDRLATIARNEISEIQGAITQLQHPRDIIYVLSEMLEIVGDPSKLDIEGLNRNSPNDIVVRETAKRLKELALSIEVILLPYPYRELTLREVMERDDPLPPPTVSAIAIKLYTEIAKKVFKQILTRSHDPEKNAAYRAALGSAIEFLQIIDVDLER